MGSYGFRKQSQNDNGKVNNFTEENYTPKNSNNTFLLINENKKRKNNDNKIENNFGFSDLSFKNLYIESNYFEHVITHINDISKDKSISNKDKKNIDYISQFINKNHFTEEILENIVNNGIPNKLPCLRPLVWKALIGYLPVNDLLNWKKLTIFYYIKYNKIKKKYPEYPLNITEEQDQKIIAQLDKDLARTRPEEEFFKKNSLTNDKETNYDVLKRILFFYAKEHSDLLYVQGMNEIIALIYYIYSLDDNDFIKIFIESDVYFSFELIMEEIKPIFKMSDISYSQLFITIQINNIKEILNKVEPDIINYLQDIDLMLDSLIMRWIIVLFAQEFQIDKAINFWDRLLTQNDKVKFICFISVAIIKMNKNEILGKEIEDVMNWSSSFGNKIDISETVEIALDIRTKFKNKEI